MLTDIYHYLIFKINVVFVGILSYSNKIGEKNSKWTKTNNFQAQKNANLIISLFSGFLYRIRCLGLLNNFSSIFSKF